MMLPSGFDLLQTYLLMTPFILLECHHVVQECQTEVDDIIHDMDQQMHHNVKECGREVHLKLI
jgi:hypothetical protein